MPTRERPAIEARLYTEGDADPVLTDHGFGWWDNLAETFGYGDVTQSGGLPALEYVAGIGMVCRPRLVGASLRLTHASTSGGTWSEVRPVGIGAGLTYRLVQSDTTAGVSWVARSVYAAPADAAFAWTLVVWDTPADHNITTYPPRVRLAVGLAGNTAQWCIELDKAAGNSLCRWLNGAWVRAMALPSLDTSGDNGEAHIWLRVHRSRIAISFDRGTSYSVFTPPDGSIATVRAGGWGIEGQGGGVVVGFHQLTYATGVFTSRVKGTLVARALAPAVSIAGRKNEPAGTTVSLADVGAYGSAQAQYTATLTPATTAAATPFTWHHSPELYTVTYRIAPIETTVTQAYALIPDTQIIGVRITKPEDLSESSAVLTLRRKASSAWSGTYRNRKVLIRLGWYLSDTTYEWTSVFTAYVVAQRVVFTTPQEIGVELTLANVGHRLKRVPWQPDYEAPLGGQTVNQALDAVLATEGIPRNGSYRTWHADGDLVTVPAGLPENPAEMTRRGEAKWATLSRLASYAGLRLGVSDAGVLVTVPPTYVTGTIHDVRFGTGWVTDDEVGRGVERSIDYRESLTAAFVTGESEYGEDLVRAAIDTYAETNTGSGRFTPWREATVDGVPGTVTGGILAKRAQALAQERFGLLDEVRAIVLSDPTIGRRDELRLYGGSALGIADGTLHVVLSLETTVSIDPRTGAYETMTAAGARRS